MDTSACIETTADACAVAKPELAIAFTDPDRLERFVCARSREVAREWAAKFGLAGSAGPDAWETWRLSRVHFGNEFCERLLPSRSVLASVINLISDAGMSLSFVTPMLSDDGLDATDQLLAALPDHSEVVANDWGLIHRVQRCFPRLRLSVGRLLNRALKEPRAPSALFMKLGGHGFMNPGFEGLLRRFGLSRLEIDVPPFATSQDLRAPGHRVSLHVPFGFATVGRICRIGSTHQPPGRKFATGHNCARECLAYAASMESPRDSEIRVFQRGNTIFYRHTPAMTAVVADAIAAGFVDRVIVSGDWNEPSSADLSA